MARSRFGIIASLLFTPRESIRDPLVVVEDGRILSVASRESTDTPANLRIVNFPDAILGPGLVDIHIHGGAGHDVMEGDEDALAAIEGHLARNGTTSYFPTTVTAPVDATLRSLEKLGAAIERSGNGDLRAQPLGVHLEGPFISHAKRGIHPAEYIQPPSLELFDRMWQAAGGHVGLITIAPEVPGATELIAEAARRGICVSLGHSDSDLEPVQVAMLAGARHATHTFNAMRPLDHRNPGILGAVLADPGLTADIIADGIHVHPEVVRLFLQAKGPEGAVLITDGLSAAGMGDGRYRLGSFEFEVQGDRCTRDGTLAGSVLTLGRAVANVMKFADWNLKDAIRLATLNPARVAGVATRQEGSKLVPWKGVVEPGADADLVVLSASGEVIRTIVRGAGI